MIYFQCPTCLKKLKAPDKAMGHKIHCPGCGQRLLVPPPIRTQVRDKAIIGQPTPAPPEKLDEGQAAEGMSEPPSVPQRPAGQAFCECPTCHVTLNVPEQMIGHMVTCPKCQTIFAALSDDDPKDKSDVDSFVRSETKARQPHRDESESSQADLDESRSRERGVDEKYCHECGAVIRARAEICPNCGVRQPRQFREGSSLEPHRGTAILVMGILGLVFCPLSLVVGLVFWPCGLLGLLGLPFGLIAWLWANEDLRKMNKGIMDPEGRGSTQAGKICGMIPTIIFLVAIGLYVLLFFLLIVFPSKRW
jgi:DNA-directed RNA polymerase subunit RPC12/RpoP